MKPHNFVYTGVTSINSKKVPLLFKKISWTPGTINFDIAGGKYDTATEYLKNIGVHNIIWDPYSRDTNWNSNALFDISSKADTATLSNVLNVIPEKKERLKLIFLAYKSIKDNGILYVSIYEGDKTGTGKISKRKKNIPIAWQENRKIETYLNEIKKYFYRAYINNKIIFAYKKILTK